MSVCDIPRNTDGVRVLTLTIDGKRLTFAAFVGARDPMEMTLGEWRSAPVLSAAALLNGLLASRSLP